MRSNGGMMIHDDDDDDVDDDDDSVSIAVLIFSQTDQQVSSRAPLYSIKI